MGMNVNLSPILDNFVAEQVKSGLYSNASEVVREGLRMLYEKKCHKRNELLRVALIEAIAQADSGKVVDGRSFMQKTIQDLNSKL